MFRARFVCAAFATAAVAVAGCGSSADSTSSGTGASTPTTKNEPVATPTTKSEPVGPPVSRSALIAKANAVCGRLIVQRSSINIRTPQEYEGAVSRLAAEEQAAFAELGKIRPPSALAADWQRLVDGGLKLSRDTARLAAYGSSYNRRSARITYREGIAVQHSMRAIAKRDNFSTCAHFA